MTIRRFGMALVGLTLGIGCAEAVSLDKGDPGSGSGGSATENGGATSNAGNTSKPVGGSTGSNGGSTGSVGGNGGSTATTPAGGSTATTTSVVTPTSCGTTSGELTLAHAAQSGGSGFTGTSTITPGTVTTFNADAVKLKICFSTIGEVPAALTGANMKIYHAAIEGGPAYTALTDTPISLEKPETTRFCFLFDLSQTTTASGVTVSGAASLKYNWSFDSSQVTGLSLDTREGHKPEIIVLYNDAVAACTLIV